MKLSVKSKQILNIMKTGYLVRGQLGYLKYKKFDVNQSKPLNSLNSYEKSINSLNTNLNQTEKPSQRIFGNLVFFSIIVPKKVCKLATDRNKIKRQFRAIFQQQIKQILKDIKFNKQYLFVYYFQKLDNYQNYKKELKNILDKILL